MAQTTSQPRQRPWLAHLLALGCYTLMALAVTWPMPLHWRSQVIANGPGQNDAYLGIWNIWWTAQALSGGRDPFVTPLLFHPQGLDLFWQTLSLPQGLLALPLTLTLGPLPAYNALILAGFILGGYGTFLLARSMLRAGASPAPHTEAAALVAGAVYAFAPFHMQKVLDAQLEVAGVQWLPLYAWALLLLLERRRWPWALLAGALLLWVGLGTWYYGLFALIVTGLAAGLWAIQGKAESRKPIAETAKRKHSGAAITSEAAFSFQFSAFSFLWGLAPLLIWLIVMAPRLIDLARRGDTLLGVTLLDKLDSSANLVAFWLPNPNHPLWGAAVSQYYLAIHPGAILWNVSLGVVGTLLGVIGLAVSWRQSWRWAAIGVITAVLAMGPTLNIHTWRTGLPMPYALIQDLPGIRSSHRPNHFVLITILSTALLAGYGAQWLLTQATRHAVRPDEPQHDPAPGDHPSTRSTTVQRSSRQAAKAQRFRIRTTSLALNSSSLRGIATRSAFPSMPASLLTAGLLIALLAIDGWAGPPPLFARPVPQPYLAMPPSDGALLPIPLHINFSNSENLWYQTFHRRPIVGGFIGREPPYPLARYAPGVRELRFGRAEPDDILSTGWPALARESLAAYNIRYVMFHRATMGSSLPQMTALIDDLGLEPSYSDDLITVYPVPEPPQPRPLAYLGAGWDKLEHEGERRWRWMGDAAEIYLLNPTGAPKPIRLGLDMEAFDRDRRLTLRLGDGAPFTVEVSRARMQRTLHLILPPGEHVLYLGAPADPLPNQSSRRLSIAMLGIGIK